MESLKKITQGQGIGHWQRTLAQNKGQPFVEGTTGKVSARVNHGRWLANCQYCAGAELVEPGEVFFCFSCGMKQNDGHPAEVVFPKDRTAIDDALRARAEENQNWEIKETVADLLKENKDNGIKEK